MVINSTWQFRNCFGCWFWHRKGLIYLVILLALKWHRKMYLYSATQWPTVFHRKSETKKKSWMNKKKYYVNCTLKKIAFEVGHLSSSLPHTNKRQLSLSLIYSVVVFFLFVCAEWHKIRIKNWWRFGAFIVAVLVNGLSNFRIQRADAHSS